MKKCSLLLMICCLLTVPAAAHAGQGPARNSLTFKMGYMSPSIDIVNPSGDNIRFDPGVYLELSYARMYGDIGVRAAVGYANNTCSETYQMEDGSQETYKGWLDSVNIPLTFMYSHDFGMMNVYAGAGPGLYYRKLKVEYDNRSYQETETSKSLNGGLQALIGIDVTLAKYLVMSAELEYNLYRIRFDGDYSNNGTAGEFNPSLSIGCSF